ncbi:MAG: hypothetical protein ACF8QF_07385 [Phycisphaerales bacterium]
MRPALLICAAGACALGAVAFASNPDAKSPTRTTALAGEAPVGASPLCGYPNPRPFAPSEGGLRLLNIAESESNGSLGTADPLPLSDAEPEIDVTGSLTSGDVDFFEVQMNEGDWLNAAMVSPTTPDTKIAIVNAGGSVELSNDDDNGQSGIYPVSSTLLRTGGLNPNVAWIAPATGTYYLRVIGFNSGQTGPYTMQVRLNKGGWTSLNAGEKQIIFVDFNGATINAAAIFGSGNTTANLSPLSNFLPSWGLANNATNLNAIIDGVMAKIEQNFEELRSIYPDFDYELRNSRDDADPWGQPNVSRLIVGGTQGQLGIGTIGIAESIDPGNFDRTETAVILLDILSSASQSIACQNINRAAGVSIIEAISRGVGNIASHEAGHYLGCWHTNNSNFTACLIDSGGGLFERNIYDTGPDEVIGTPDDFESSFTTDTYAGEGIGESGSIENSGWRVAYGLRVPASCVGDLDGSGSIDGADLGLLLGAWGSPGVTDLNNDGTTDGADLGLLLGAWGPC